MALIDKLADKALPAHEFTASCLGWFVGDFTRQQVIDGWSLVAADEDQLDEAKTAYDAESSAADKIVYCMKLERYVELLLAGKITQANFKTLMGWT